MQYPKNQMEFEDWFSTEEKCRDYLISLKWSGGFVCDGCRGETYWNKNRGRIVCRKCRREHYLLADTIFQSSHKPLHLWFRAMWWMLGEKNGVSALGLQSVLGLGSYRTAWLWLHKLRRAMVVPGRDLLSGSVEVDETFIGGEHSGKRGRGAEGKALVVVGAEVKGKVIGRIRLQVIPNARGDSLMGFITTHIEKGSSISTDGWTGYLGLKEAGYSHNIYKMSASVGEEIQLPNVHKIASLLKRWLMGTHQGGIQHKHLPYYLDEYTFRFNRRNSKSRGLLFFRLLEQAVTQAPSTFKEISGKTN